MPQIDVEQSGADGSQQHYSPEAMVSPNSGTRLRPSSATRRDRTSIGTTSSTAQDTSVLLDGEDDLTTPVKVNLRKEIELKKARAKADEEANLTFKPSMYTSHHKSNSSATKAPQSSVEMSPRENRFDKLYSDALKRHLSSTTKEELLRDKELTFTPKLTSRSSSRQNSRPSSRSKDRPTNESVDTTIATNATSATPVHERLSTPTRVLRRVDNSDNNSEFSFTPSISKRAKSIERLGAGEVSRRLYEHNNTAREKIEQKKIEYQQKELEACTFSPQLVAKRSGSASRGKPITETTEPLIDRVTKYEENKKKKLEMARRMKEQDEIADATFKPVLVTNKRPSTPTSRMPVHERLAIPMEKSVSPSVALAYEELTFQPKLIAKRGPTSPNNKNASESQESVHDRLFKEGVARKVEQDHERAMKREEQGSSLTFKPEINRDYKLSDDRAEGPVFTRLATNYQKVEVKEKIERIQAELTREWTFSPVISEKSKKITTAKEESPLPIYDRLAEDDRLAREDADRKRREKEQKEEEELKALSFQPRLPRKSISIAKRSSIIGDSDIYQRLLHTHLEGHKLNESMSEASVATVETDAKKVVLPEKNIQEICRRLSVTQIGKIDLPPPEVKKVVMPEQDVNTIFNRLQSKRTKSFILKHDSEEAEKFIREHSGVKEGPKLSQAEMDSVLERLRNQTASSGVYNEIGHARRQSISANSSPARRESFSTSPMRRESFSNSTSPTPLNRSLSRMDSNGSINSLTSSDFLQPSFSRSADGIAAMEPQQQQQQQQQRIFASPPKLLSAMNIFAQVSDDNEEDDQVEGVPIMLDPSLSKSSRSLSIIKEAEESDVDDENSTDHHHHEPSIEPEANLPTLHENEEELPITVEETETNTSAIVENENEQNDKSVSEAFLKGEAVSENDTVTEFVEESQISQVEEESQLEEEGSLKEEDATTTAVVVNENETNGPTNDTEVIEESEELNLVNVPSTSDVGENNKPLIADEQPPVSEVQEVSQENIEKISDDAAIQEEEKEAEEEVAVSSIEPPKEQTQEEKAEVQVNVEDYNAPIVMVVEDKREEDAIVLPEPQVVEREQTPPKVVEQKMIAETVEVEEATTNYGTSDTSANSVSLREDTQQPSSVKKLVESFSKASNKAETTESDSAKVKSRIPISELMRKDSKKELTKRPSFNNGKNASPRRSPSPSKEVTLQDDNGIQEVPAIPQITAHEPAKTEVIEIQEDDELNILLEVPPHLEERPKSRASPVVNTEPVSLPVPVPPAQLQPKHIEVPQVMIPPTPPTKSLSRKPSEEFEKKLDEISAMCDPSYFTSRNIVLDPSIKLGEEVITPKAVISEPTSTKNSSNNANGHSKPPKVPTPTSVNSTPTSSKSNSFASPTAAKSNSKASSTPVGKSSEPRSLKGGKKRQQGANDSADEGSVNSTTEATED